MLSDLNLLAKYDIFRKNHQLIEPDNPKPNGPIYDKCKYLDFSLLTALPLKVTVSPDIVLYFRFWNIKLVFFCRTAYGCT